MISPEEPLADAAYCYDGTPEGLFTAVFKAYELHEDPLDVVREACLQPRLGQIVRYIDADDELARRVERGIRRTCGRASFEAALRASLADDPKAGTAVYRFVRHAMAAKRNVLGDLAHPAVGPVQRLARSVMNERHRMLQFLRFEHMENGVWFAQCNPSAAVVPLVMDWFSGRFNTQPFIIYDEVHAIAGVYDGDGWYLVPSSEVVLPDRASEERLMQAAWKRFYDTVAVEARYNPELRRQFMPKRLWKNIVEMQERIPGTDLAR
ncbi:TIGR03915 family putative DNA repair protein [Arabiibacter massiliensis]|uniref:TIGR03915 family putative DNA repair protein n=1 Tax=Arabiibacter massiliensis TaxID=1870985 RepID=UPI000B425DE0|nr:TIGR03915 family putative DNA repair protein [Arabiibacter massiliensis]